MELYTLCFAQSLLCANTSILSAPFQCDDDRIWIITQHFLNETVVFLRTGKKDTRSVVKRRQYLSGIHENGHTLCVIRNYRSALTRTIFTLLNLRQDRMRGMKKRAKNSGPCWLPFALACLQVSPLLTPSLSTQGVIPLYRDSSYPPSAFFKPGPVLACWLSRRDWTLKPVGVNWEVHWTNTACRTSKSPRDLLPFLAFDPCLPGQKRFSKSWQLLLKKILKN